MKKRQKKKTSLSIRFLVPGNSESGTWGQFLFAGMSLGILFQKIVGRLEEERFRILWERGRLFAVFLLIVQGVLEVGLRFSVVLDTDDIRKMAEDQDSD